MSRRCVFSSTAISASLSNRLEVAVSLMDESLANGLRQSSGPPPKTWTRGWLKRRKAIEALHGFLELPTSDYDPTVVSLKV
jgi:hypothetical protein